MHAESSGLARTLQSAYALHAGLFPQGSVASSGGAVVPVPVPVYSRPTGHGARGGPREGGGLELGIPMEKCLEKPGKMDDTIENIIGNHRKAKYFRM